MHINTVLVRANSPERAYERALKLGQEAEHEYENTEDKKVQTIFRGLRDLTVVHDKLQHGTELFYREEIGLDEEDLLAIIADKTDLTVFKAWQKPSTETPNYMPKSVMEKLREMGFEESDLRQSPESP